MQLSQWDHHVSISLFYVLTGEEVHRLLRHFLNVKQNTNVTIVGTAYVSTMDASPVVLYDGKEITKLEQGTKYDISKFTISPDSYTSVGELTIGNPEVTCTGSFVDVEAGTVTGDSASKYTFTFNYYLESNLTASEKKIEVTLGVFPGV